jgi:hypothetical protein
MAFNVKPSSKFSVSGSGRRACPRSFREVETLFCKAVAA